MTRLYLDADACPVKSEACRVAARHGVAVRVVANSFLAVPPGAELVRVGGGFDEADDWIAASAGPGDVVVTDDIPLAARCLADGARVVGSRGREFTEASIGDALASREVLSQLREHGLAPGGPAPFGPKDRSRFLDRLDTVLRAALRGA